MPSGVLNKTEPLNRNWGPNKHLAMRLLCLPDQQKGTIWRDITGKNNATFAASTAAPTWAPTSKRKEAFGAVSFDGINDYAESPSLAALNGTSSVTMSVWGKRTGSSGTYGSIIGQATSTTVRCIFQPWSDGNVYFSVGAGSGSYVGCASTHDNNWHHWCLVFDGSQATNATRAKIYKDGKEQILTLFSGTIPSAIGVNTATFRVGNDFPNSLLGAFICDDVAVHSRPLNAEEVMDCYRDSSQGYPRGLNWLQSPRVAPSSSNNYTLSCSAGSFALTGNATTLKASRNLTVSAGSFGLTGNAATLKADRKLNPASGSFSLTGQDASLLAARTLSPSAGSFSLSGNSVNLKADRRLTVATGVYVLTGKPVILRKSSSSGSRLLLLRRRNAQ